MLSRHLLLGSGVATLLGGEARASSPLVTLLPALMAKHGVPAVSAALIDDGRVPDIVTIGAPPEALFQAASISKVVAGLTVLRLWESRALDLDAPVNTLLRSWKLGGPGAERVTPRLLLCHRGGTNVPGFAGYAAGVTLPTLLQTLDGAPPANNARVEVTTPPGAAYRYSGGGTTILQQIVDDVCAQPFERIVRDLVLGPAGMERSSYAMPREKAADAVTAHDDRGKPLPGRWKAYPELAAAGLWSNARELAALAMQIAQSWRSGGLLRRDTARLMTTPVEGGPTGLGLFVSPRADLAPYVFHYGVNAGFNSLLLASADGACGCVVMTNADTGHLLIRDFVTALTEARGQPAFEAQP